MNSFGNPSNPMMPFGAVTSLAPLGGVGMMPAMSPGMGTMDPSGMSMASMRCCQGPQMASGMMGQGMMGSTDALAQMLMMEQQIIMGMMQLLLGLLMGQQLGGNLLGGSGLPGLGGVGGSGGGGGIGGGGGGGSTATRGGSGARSGGSSSGASADSGPVNPGVGGLLEHANRMVGLDENRDTAAIQKVTGKSGINPASTPWCAAWAMNMLEQHGIMKLDGLSNRNYCPTVKSWGKDKGTWQEGGRYTPKAGDAILFDWEGDGTPDHIGIVERVEGGKVYTIEGNSSDKVSKRSYALGSSNIDGYLKT